MSGDERSDLLRWYVEMGADEAIADEPHDRFAPAPAPPPRPVAAAVPPLPMESSGSVASAKTVAASATTLDALRQAVASFEGCALKRTATNTVFADGVAGAPLMVIGEAPGADEDRQGLPFVGRSGQLLDRMLAAIGRDRKRNAYITNMLFWRPPGNRKPTDEEIATCLPFVWRHVALAKPRVILLSGGTAAASLLGRQDGITRLRGRWYPLAVPGLDHPVPTLATYHPSFLLRSPARKGEAWHDFLEVQAKLESSE
jgi:uracil-DNA glycosylase